jgi:hypothetical protein
MHRSRIFLARLSCDGSTSKKDELFQEQQATVVAYELFTEQGVRYSPGPRG